MRKEMKRLFLLIAMFVLYTFPVVFTIVFFTAFMVGNKPLSLFILGLVCCAVAYPCIKLADKIAEEI